MRTECSRDCQELPHRALDGGRVPAAGVWGPIDLKTIVPTYPISGELGHWVRIQPSALLDAVVITQLSPLQWDIADTTGKWHAGKFKTVQEYTIDLPGDVGALERGGVPETTPSTFRADSPVFRREESRERRGRVFPRDDVSAHRSRAVPSG